MRQGWGSHLAQLWGLGADWVGGEALASRKAGRMILRFAQNDKGRGETGSGIGKWGR
jgi:hypothetical protein